MPAPRKYDQETRDRAVRMYQERRRDFPEEALRASRRRVGEILEVHPETMRGWIDQVEVDSGRRPGVSSEVAVELQALSADAELRRANEILRTASAFFAAAELDRRLK